MSQLAFPIASSSLSIHSLIHTLTGAIPAWTQSTTPLQPTHLNTSTSSTQASPPPSHISPSTAPFSPPAIPLSSLPHSTPAQNNLLSTSAQNILPPTPTQKVPQQQQHQNKLSSPPLNPSPTLSPAPSSTLASPLCVALQKPPALSQVRVRLCACCVCGCVMCACICFSINIFTCHKLCHGPHLSKQQYHTHLHAHSHPPPYRCKPQQQHT